MAIAKVIHLRVIGDGQVDSAMKVVGLHADKVCHIFRQNEKINGRIIVTMHERDEICSLCGRNEDYTRRLV